MEHEVSVARELGRLSEAMERAKEDRAEILTSHERMRESVDRLSSRVDALNQTMQSTSNAVNQIALEKCGERLDKLESLVNPAMLEERLSRLEDVEKTCERLEAVETTVNSWRRWIGKSWGFLLRVIVAVIASGAIGGSSFSIAAKIWSRLLAQ